MLSGPFIHAIVHGWTSLKDDYMLRHLCPDFRERYMRLQQLPLDVAIPPVSLTHFLVEPALDGQEVDRNSHSHVRIY